MSVVNDSQMGHVATYSIDIDFMFSVLMRSYLCRPRRRSRHYNFIRARDMLGDRQEFRKVERLTDMQTRSSTMTSVTVWGSVLACRTHCILFCPKHVSAHICALVCVCVPVSARVRVCVCACVCVCVCRTVCALSHTTGYVLL